MSEHNPLEEFNSCIPGLPITLPTLGFFYGDGIVREGTNFEEFQVQPFSLWSEMRFRDFGAIMSGQATKELLATVAPQVIDFARMTAVDVEIIMAASRKASYGDDMKIEVTCTNPEKTEDGKPVCVEQTTFAVNLPQLIASYPVLNKEDMSNWHIELAAAGDKKIKFNLKLPEYMSSLEALRIYVEQKQTQVLVETGTFDQLDDAQKEKMTEKATINFININVLNVAASIASIEMPSGSVVSDKAMIHEIVSSKSFPNSWLDTITEKLDVLTAPFKNCGTQSVECPKCQHVIKDIPVIGDPAHFFSRSSQE
jgi:hypothetical protein